MCERVVFVNSVAILRYLASFSAQDHWYPKERRQRALVDEYLGWQHTGLRKHGVALFIEQVSCSLLFFVFISERFKKTSRLCHAVIVMYRGSSSKKLITTIVKRRVARGRKCTHVVLSIRSC